MKMQQEIKIGLVLALGFLGVHGTAQETDPIGTQTVTVTKAYTPTISDAFKIKSNPNLNDSIVLQKKEIEYSIFSVPVASTYTPSKAKAATVEKTPPPVLYNSYASVGLGNYNNALVDFYTSRSLNRGEDLFDIGFNHHSSRGDVDGVALDNVFYNTKLNGSYAKKDRDLDWGVNLGLQHQLYNWYGILDENNDGTLGDIDAKQNYFMGEIGAHLNLEDYYFKGGKILYRRFQDAVQSAENRITFTPVVELPVTDEMLTLKLNVDYVGGNFENASLNSSDNLEGIKYSHLQAGITPSLLILRDDLTLNLGANIVYGMDMELSDSKFFIYPEITASYRLLEDQVIAYGGIEGELRQNSYYGFVEDNPYVSPTLSILPTDQQYDGYIGIKGQLLSNVSYNLKGSYMAENNKPLFMLNPSNGFRDDEKGYYYGNSFGLFYDDVKTLGVFGEISVDVNRNFTLGVNAEMYDYDTETDNPAWNLPSMQGSLFMDYQIGEQWFMGANLFYVGKRDDLSSEVVQNVQPSDFPSTIIALDGYFDANAHIGYRFNDQLSIFAKASNIANNNYQRWANYPVQGFQILAGASYKFDF